MEEKKFLIEWLKDGAVHYLKLIHERGITRDFSGNINGERIIEREVWAKDANEAFHFSSRELAENYGNSNGLFNYYKGSKVEEHEFINYMPKNQSIKPE